MASLKDNNITKLSNDNYSIWKFKMEMILIKEDLFDVIENDTPETPDDKFLKRDRQARAIINLCIEDSQIINVKNETSAKSTWNKLKAIHERSNLSSKLFLLRKLYSTKMSEDGNMNEHIAQMLELIDKLKAVGEEIKDDHIAALLLVSLPKSYDNLITALEARPETELTPELIKNKLTDEYNRRTEMNADRGISQVFKTNVFKQSRNKSDKFCSYCKKPFHSRNECFHLNNNKPFQNRNSNKYYSSLEDKNTGKNANYRKFNSNVAAANDKNKIRKNDKSSVCMQSTEQNFKPSQDRRRFSEMKILKEKKTQKTVRDESPINKIDEMNCEANSAPNNENKNVDECTFKQSVNCNLTQDFKCDFFVDSGATQHLSNNLNLYTDFNSNAEPIKIIVADGKCLYSQGIGNVHIRTKLSNGIEQDINLMNVYFLPELECNLISVKRITEKGFTVTFNESKCFVTRNQITYLEAVSSNNSLYKVTLIENTGKNISPTLALNCKNDNCINFWHKRLGHRSTDAIKQLVRENLADGIAIDNCDKEKNCEQCIKNKITEFPYPNESKFKAKSSLELVHSDLCGPIQTQSVSGKRYFLTFVDDFSRFTMIYLIANKNEVFSKLKEYVAVTKNKFDKTLKALRSDNGGEYTSEEMEEFMKNLGIDHQFTVPHSPPQNGVAERKNRSLMEMTRCLLSEANLPHKYWAEAVMTANYLQNRLPTKAKSKTPYELWHDRKPDLSNIRIFGSKAFAHIHKSKRGKLDKKTVEGILIGYDNRSKGYRILMSDDRVIISRTVRFIEDTTSSNEITVTLPKQIENEEEENDEMSEEDSDITKKQLPIPVEPRRSERINKGKPPEKLTYFAGEEMKEPKSFKELDSLNPEEKMKWLEAIKEEMQSLKKNHTWDLVKLPKNKKAIGCKWTFKAKLNENGTIERYKARLVAKGFSQKFGTDYDQTFAPVVKHTTIRALLTAAAHKNMHVKHIDIKAAFLNGDLKEDIYMKQPEGFVEPGDDHEKKVCKLRKTIYGLKQAAYAWNQKIAEVLLRNNFRQSMADSCLFTKTDEDENILVILYVDDLLISSKDEAKINKVIDILKENFEIKNLGEVKHYLGINIQRNIDGSFELNQKVKIEELLKKFDLKEKKPTYIPMETSYPRNEDDSNLLDDNKVYRQAIGALLYIATVSRPDIALPVNILSRKIEQPSEKDWKAVQKIIMYLNTTKNLNLVLSSQNDPILTCYSDADWAGDKETRKSTSGNIFLLGDNPISWFSKRQNCIALSSAESEYIAAANAAQEVQWLLTLLEDLGLKQSLPIKLYEDNKSCIILTQTGKYSARTKHIDVKHHYIRQLQELNIILVDYCSSKAMIADILTKPLPKPQFLKLREKLNLTFFPNR